MLARCDFDPASYAPRELKPGAPRALAQVITALELGVFDNGKILEQAKAKPAPVLGITGTGGAGKSSLTDELVRRFRLDQGDSLRIAVLSVDPTRRKTGGALLGDRIRMNAIDAPNIFNAIARYPRHRQRGVGGARRCHRCVPRRRLSARDGGDAGIGQGDAAIVPHADASLYVMTPEFGAASQLEKIDMLDFADFVAINKFDRKGAEDALRDVRKQVQRNREAFRTPAEEMPVFGTIAARFNDDGVTALYQAVVAKLAGKGLKLKPGKLPKPQARVSSAVHAIVPPQRTRYLAEITESVRSYHAFAAEQSRIARERQQLAATGRCSASRFPNSID